MKILIVLLILFGGVLGMAAMAYVIGLFVPRAHEETRGREVPQSCERVWKRLTDFERFPDWQPWMARVERLHGGDGVGGVWRHVEKRGDHLDLEVTEMEPPRRLVTTIADPSLPFKGSWTMELEPKGINCRLQITERGEVPNPLMRTLWVLFRPAKSSVEKFLEAV